MQVTPQLAAHHRAVVAELRRLTNGSARR
jgi:hypothetical protein